MHFVSLQQLSVACSAMYQSALAVVLLPNVLMYLISGFSIKQLHCTESGTWGNGYLVHCHLVQTMSLYS